MPRNAPSLEESLRRLEAMRSWSEDWDGEGAPAPCQSSLQEMVALARLVTAMGVAFSVGLDADARPTLDLRDREGHVTVERDGSLSFSFDQGAGTPLDGYGLPFDGGVLPPTLSAALNGEG